MFHYRVRHTLKWFKNREGRKIYRKRSDTCNCDMCQSTEVFIHPANGEDDHAAYIKLCQDELGIEYYSQPIKE